MRVYFDVCSLQRPFDDRSQPRINIEAEAMSTLLRLVESGHLTMLASEALIFEVDRMPDVERQARTKEILALASKTMELADEIEAQADAFVQAGLRPLDALHVAFASWGKADCFWTCDEKLLKKSKRLKKLMTKVVSPFN